jgi:hypothetical protein
MGLILMDGTIKLSNEEENQRHTCKHGNIVVRCLKIIQHDLLDSPALEVELIDRAASKAPSVLCRSLVPYMLSCYQPWLR